ncbi:hypothetical protein M0R72_17320 [Candidatus Pacearchaeota archaeon]|nr:hypothetical protein [Candidatus Pacearchaeota archaeon]
MMKFLAIICLLSTPCLAESPEELLNSTSNLSLPEAAFLLATHGYDVTYEGGMFMLNGTEFRKQDLK